MYIYLALGRFRLLNRAAKFNTDYCTTMMTSYVLRNTFPLRMRHTDDVTPTNINTHRLHLQIYNQLQILALVYGTLLALEYPPM